MVHRETGGNDSVSIDNKGYYGFGLGGGEPRVPVVSKSPLL